MKIDLGDWYEKSDIFLASHPIEKHSFNTVATLFCTQKNIPHPMNIDASTIRTKW